MENVISAIPIEPYGLEVARTHAGLLAYTRRSGRPRGAHDLLIAATALARDRIVVSASGTESKLPIELTAHMTHLGAPKSAGPGRWVDLELNAGGADGNLSAT